MSGTRIKAGGTQSPALGLLHELGHARDFIKLLKKYNGNFGRAYVEFLKKYNKQVDKYGKETEKDVIETYETPAAKALGEDTRESHNQDTAYETESSTSREEKKKKDDKKKH